MRLWVFFIAMVLVSGLLVASEDSVPTGLSADQSVDYSNSDLDLNNPNADLNLVDWSARSQAEVPLNRISELRADIIKIEEISDKTRITAEQWAYESNLNKADDLSLYSEPRIVVSGKHPGMKVDLISGHARYEDGILTNGDAPHINLNDQHLMGTKISSLLDGGFLLERGTSQGKFEVDGATYDLSSDMMASAQIKSKEEIVLSKGAQMIDTFGTRIVSDQNGMKVHLTEKSLSVEGRGVVYDKFGNVGKVGDGDASERGMLRIDYDTPKYTMEQASMLLREGTLHISDKTVLAGDNIVIMDEHNQRVLADSLEGVFRKLSSKGKECDANGCSYVGGISVSEVVKTSAIENGIEVTQIKEQTGIPEPLSVSLAVAGMLAIKQFPNQKTFESKDGTFRSVIGYNPEGLTPYLVAAVDRNTIRFEPDSGSGGVATTIEVPLGSENTLSTEVILSPYVPDQVGLGLGVGGISAQLDLAQQGLLTMSYYDTGAKSGVIKYRREVGKVSGSLQVRGSENMNTNVMANIDLARVFD